MFSFGTVSSGQKKSSTSIFNRASCYYWYLDDLNSNLHWFFVQNSFQIYVKVDRHIWVYLCTWVFCLHFYLCIMHMPGLSRGQMRLSDFLALELQMVMKMPCGAKIKYWPSRMAKVLLTDEPSFRFQICVF